MGTLSTHCGIFVLAAVGGSGRCTSVLLPDQSAMRHMPNAPAQHFVSWVCGDTGLTCRVCTVSSAAGDTNRGTSVSLPTPNLTHAALQTSVTEPGHPPPALSCFLQPISPAVYVSSAAGDTNRGTCVSRPWCHSLKVQSPTDSSSSGRKGLKHRHTTGPACGPNTSLV
jgi:hypothetical protein